MTASGKAALAIGVMAHAVAGGTPLQGAGTSAAQEARTLLLNLSLDSVDGLEVPSFKGAGVRPVTTEARVVAYRGRQAVRVIDGGDRPTTPARTPGQALVIVKASDFANGTIEMDVAGLPRRGAPADTRGFVGIAFRVQAHGSQYECIYLRMTNGRSDDQVRRNHSTQYVSEPDFPWERLRKESPGTYESYVDLAPGSWTAMKIVVAGTTASLYVNGADQPALIVNDLKLGRTHGQIALWTGSDTEAYFSHLVVRD